MSRAALALAACLVGTAVSGGLAQTAGASKPASKPAARGAAPANPQFDRLVRDAAAARDAGRIEDSIATVFRQIAMNRFEDAVHTSRRDEGELSPERFEEVWLGTQRQMFGDSVDVEGYETWWSYIPHFIGTPGYVYAYAYGFLFALSIFRKYELEGDSMVEPYLDVLRAGGSKPPEALAEMVGLDLTDPKIWEAGIDALAVELDEAEALAADIGL